MSIEVQQLRKEYGSQVAVNDVSFTAPRGSITGFLGPNGAGKSTTMKMITGYLQPDGGEVLVDGISATREPLRTKRMIGYLPESNALYYDMYVREYLQFTASLYPQQRPLRQAIEETIELVGLGPEAHKKTGQLSKGYKQRVGLAAAIIHQPSVLILDEPTSGLDPNQIVEIRQVIRQLSQEKTVLLSTHIMQEVEAICQQVVIINKGQVVANQSLAELQHMQQRPGLRVSFSDVLEAEWLLRLPAIVQAEKIDRLSWQVTAADTQAASQQLLQMAAEANVRITSLQEGASLEDLFRQLTTQVEQAVK